MVAAKILELDNPLEVPSLWEFILVGGVRSPGLAELSGAERSFNWDTKVAPGTEGATSTYKGKGPVTFTVKLKFWEAEQINDWNVFRERLNYDAKKKKVEPVDIIHPALAQNGIGAVVTKKIGQLTHEGHGLYSVSIEFLEYFPPAKKNVTKTPTGAQAKLDGFWTQSKDGLLDKVKLQPETPKSSQTQAQQDRAAMIAALGKL